MYAKNITPSIEMFFARAIPLALFLCSITCGFAESSGHPVLLPRPQNAAYAPGQLDLHGVHIVLSAGPPPEDAFSAQQLSTCLRSRTQQEVPVGDLESPGIAIHLYRTGPVEPLPGPGETPGPKSREAYSILVNSQGARIEARSSAGLFYGIQTLCQLVEANSVLPAVEIEDWPAQAYRGVMVDMSEGPLPTEAEIKRQLDFLARWKINQDFFYSEASIELSGDYAGLKFLYAAEIDSGWQTLGLHPSRDRVNAFIGSATSQQHGRLPDLMDVITGLRPHYVKAWLAEYSPYRMASALSHWDAEYENWHRIQGRLEAYPGDHAASASRPALQSLLGTWD